MIKCGAVFSDYTQLIVQIGNNSIVYEIYYKPKGKYIKYNRYNTIYDEKDYSAFKNLTDSLLKICPDKNFYTMYLYRGACNEYTEILTQRFDQSMATIADIEDSYGVIADGYNKIIFLEGAKEYDLMEPTDEYINIENSLPSKGHDLFLYDANISMFMFDKIRLYKMSRDITMTPISEINVSNRFPYHIRDTQDSLIYVPDYNFDNGTLSFDCFYFSENGDKINAVRQFPNIIINGDPEMKKYIPKVDLEYGINISLLFFYCPDSGYYEIRYCKPSFDNRLEIILEEFIAKRMKRLKRKVDKHTPSLTRIIIKL